MNKVDLTTKAKKFNIYSVKYREGRVKIYQLKKLKFIET